MTTYRTTKSVGQERANGQGVLSGDLAATLDRLRRICQRSENNYYAAAEQVQNPGIKLLLKAYAQERNQFADELAALDRQIADGDRKSPGLEPVHAIQDGLVDTGAALTLGRENRQEVVTQALLDEENEALEAYESALNDPLPDGSADVLRRQREAIRSAVQTVAHLAHQGNKNLIVRLYDRRSDAEESLQRLGKAGFESDQTVMMDIQHLPHYADTETARHASLWRTVLANGAAGALIGLLVGVATVIFQRFGVDLSAVITVGPITMIVAPTLIGAFFGLVFGLLIGWNASEDDAFLTEESLASGDAIVMVYADSSTAADAERILSLRHERELEQSPA